MEFLIHFVGDNIIYSPFIIFFLLLLAGLNIPISEDLLVITGGFLASSVSAHYIVPWYLWIFLGCWISAWETYWIGRLLGPKLYEMRFFKRFITPKKVDQLHAYYERFGIYIFLVGRFIPGGVRNALFISSGLGKMPFKVFILRDGLGCLLSSSTLFMIGVLFANNSDFISRFVKTYQFIGLFLLLALILLFTFLYFRHRKKNISSQ